MIPAGGLAARPGKEKRVLCNIYAKITTASKGFPVDYNEVAKISDDIARRVQKIFMDRTLFEDNKVVTRKFMARVGMIGSVYKVYNHIEGRDMMFKVAIDGKTTHMINNESVLFGSGHFIHESSEYAPDGKIVLFVNSLWHGFKEPRQRFWSSEWVYNGVKERLFTLLLHEVVHGLDPDPNLRGRDGKGAGRRYTQPEQNYSLYVTQPQEITAWGTEVYRAGIYYGSRVARANIGWLRDASPEEMVKSRAQYAQMGWTYLKHGTGAFQDSEFSHLGAKIQHIKIRVIRHNKEAMRRITSMWQSGFEKGWEMAMREARAINSQ